MSRLPRPTPQQLDEPQRQLHASITGGARASGPQVFRLADDVGRLEGPFNAMLLNPEIGDALQRLGASIRYGGRLSARAREIAILTVASHWSCGFEQRAHEALAVQAGLSEAQLQGIRDAGPPDLFDDTHEAAVYELTGRLLRDADIDETSYTRVAEVLGTDVVFELTTLVGYYALLALQMRVFDVR